MVKDLSGFEGSGDKNHFFTPAEEGRLLHSLLQSVVYESVSFSVECVWYYRMSLILMFVYL